MTTIRASRAYGEVYVTYSFIEASTLSGDKVTPSGHSQDVRFAPHPDIRVARSYFQVYSFLMVREDESVRYLTLQFLDWIAASPRTYGDVIDAWRTSCPRLPVWEEAITKGLVRRANGTSMREAKVLITDKGRHALKTAHVPPIATLVSKKSAGPN